jgi:hypothetical protein
MDGADGEGTGPPRGAVARATAFLGTAILLLALGLPLLRGGEDELPAPGSGARPPAPRPAADPPGKGAPVAPAAAAGDASGAVEATPRVTSSLFPPWPGQEPEILRILVTTGLDAPADSPDRGTRLPVPGARISLLWVEAMADRPPREEVVGSTGPDGTLLVALRPWAQPLVRASAEGFGPDSALSAAGGADPVSRERDEIEICLSRLAPWRARVVDAATGAPVRGATVVNGPASATTGPDGSFEIPVPGRDDDGGPWGRLEVAAAGYARRQAEPGSLLVGDPDGGGEADPADPVIRLQPGTSLPGIVLGPDGRPFRGAEVRLDTFEYHYDPPMSELGRVPAREGHGVSRDSHQGIPAAVTGADGRFELHGIDPTRDLARVAALAPGFGISETLFFRGPDLAGRRAPVTLRLRPAGRVVVRVLRGGAPALFPPPELTGCTTLDGAEEILLREVAPGVFERDGVEPGRWLLRGRNPGGKEYFQETIEVAAGGVAERTVDLDARADFLEGVVLDEDGGPATGDIGVVVLPAALAGGEDASDHERFHFVEEETGRFRVEGLPPGEVLAWADRAGATGPRVRAATGRTGVALVAPRAAEVRVRLRLPPGAEETADASYCFLPVGRGANFSIGREAVEWPFEADPAATTLRIVATGYATLDIPLDLAPGRVADLGLCELGPAAKLVGRVEDAEGEPVSYPKVLCAGREVVHFRGGYFQIEDLPPGPVRLQVADPGFLPMEVTAVAGPGLPETVVRLRRGALLEVRPADAAFLPMEADWTARARPLPDDGPPGEPVPLPARGHQRRALRVEPGRWRVEVLRGGIVVETRDGDPGEGGALEVRFAHPR